MIFVGIDNGRSGHISTIDHRGALIEEVKMPTIIMKKKWEYDVAQMKRIFDHIMEMSEVMFGIEKSQPQQGAISTHSVTRCASLWEGLVVSASCRYQLVRPQEWKKAIFKGMKVEKGAGKDAARLMASRMWPQLNFSKKNSHDLAESLLIAEFVRRQYA